MSRRPTFADSFWGSDFVSTAGYDALKKRIREGKQTCLAFEQFLRLRAKAEEDYSKSLQKACKTVPETQESGTLRVAWDILREQSERIAQMHLEASGQLSDAAFRLNEFIKRQKAERIPRDNAVCQSAKEKASVYRKTLELKRLYDAKSNEAEQADTAYKRAKQNENSFPTKEWDKIVAKQSKSQQDAQKADSSYHDSVSKLEQIRIQWERDMNQFCVLCETLEESRIKMVQNEMWICCNILSSDCVEEDQCCESVRNVLEKVSIESDIQSFINRASTGSEKPAPVKFEQYQPAALSCSGTNSQSDNGNRLSNPQPSGISPGDHHRPHLPQPPPPQGQGAFYLPNRGYNR